MGRRANIGDFIKGWFIGKFTPSMLSTSNFEVAIKSYSKGESEAEHVHRVATEFTVVLSGNVEINGVRFSKGSIVEILPGEHAKFVAIDDSETLVVKIPSVAGDKFLSDSEKL